MKNSLFYYIKNLKLSYIVFAFVLAFFYFSVNNISTSTIDKQEVSLRNALQKDLVHCYAVEGFYPPSLEYICEHYGLSYNSDIFYVDYQPIGSNIMPNITIIRKD